jgi:hypothetical protein
MSRVSPENLLGREKRKGMSVEECIRLMVL